MKNKSIGTASDGREIYELWAWDEMFNIKKVEALKNKNQDGIFWVPKLGFSASLGHALFEDKQEAYFAAKQSILNLEKLLYAKKNNLEESYSK